MRVGEADVVGGLPGAGHRGRAAARGGRPRRRPRRRARSRCSRSRRARCRQTGEYLGSLLSRQTVSVVPQVGGLRAEDPRQAGPEGRGGQPAARGRRAPGVRRARQRPGAADVGRLGARARAADARPAPRRSTRKGLVSAQELERARAQADAAKAAVDARRRRRSRSARCSSSTSRCGPRSRARSATCSRGSATTSPRPPPLTTRRPGRGARGERRGARRARARRCEPGTPARAARHERARCSSPAPVFFVAPQADPRTQLVEVKAAFPNSVGLRPNELVRTRVVYSVAADAAGPRARGGAPVAASRSCSWWRRRTARAPSAGKPVTLGALGETAYVVEDGLKRGRPDRRLLAPGAARRRGDQAEAIAGVSSPGRGGSGTSAR